MSCPSGVDQLAPALDVFTKFAFAPSAAIDWYCTSHASASDPHWSTRHTPLPGAMPEQFENDTSCHAYVPESALSASDDSSITVVGVVPLALRICTRVEPTAAPW